MSRHVDPIYAICYVYVRESTNAFVVHCYAPCQQYLFTMYFNFFLNKLFFGYVCKRCAIIVNDEWGVCGRHSSLSLSLSIFFFLLFEKFVNRKKNSENLVQSKIYTENIDFKQERTAHSRQCSSHIRSTPKIDGYSHIHTRPVYIGVLRLYKFFSLFAMFPRLL